MSQWGNNVPAQPPTSAGQVSFFDPSKFQKGAVDFPNVPTSQQNHAAPATTQQESTDQNASQSSWSAWGTWESNGTGQDAQPGQAGQQPVNDFNQQWYGQNQWNQTPQQQNAPTQNHWDPNVQNNAPAQNQWDPNAQNNAPSQNQWDPNAQHNAPTQNTQHNTPAQNTQNDTPAQNQWDTVNTQQQHWDPSIQQQTGVSQNQWDANSQHIYQNQYNYQQPDQNQYGYNQYWGGEAGVNGHEHSNAVNQGGSIEGQTVDYSVPRNEPANADIAQSNDDLQEDSEEADTSESTSNNIQDNSDELDTTTESGSLNHSLGTYEEGNMDGYFQKEEFIQENENVVMQSNEHADTVPAGEYMSSDMYGQQIGGHYAQVAHSLGGDVQNSVQPPVPQASAMSQSDTNQGSNELFNQPPSFQSVVQPGTVPFVFQQPTAAVPPQAVVDAPREMPVAGADSKDNQEDSPGFSDWEMVPKQVAATTDTHSRNPSMDDNVHFFIGSTNSSTRVSPAQSKGGEDQDTNAGHGTSQNRTAPNIDAPPVIESQVLPSQAVQQRSDPPKADDSSRSNQGPILAPPTSIGLPPLNMGGSSAGNPFRKSPKPDLVTSANDNSVLSSTHLDSTKHDFGTESVSPIPPSQENMAHHARQRALDSPELQVATSVGNDTPLSGGMKMKESSNVPQSPITSRKESPFQPPAIKHNQGHDGRSKPVKASHDIPGVTSQMEKLSVDGTRNSNQERKEHEIKNRNTDKSYGRKTPDWDSREHRTAGRRTPDGERSQRSERGSNRRGQTYEQGRSVDQRRDDRSRGDQDPDNYRENRDKSYRDDDRLSSRPPPRPSSNAGRAPTRSRQSAFHHLQTNRTKNNVSPATSLWDTPDNLPTVSNILLMPAAGSGEASKSATEGAAPAVLTPVASLITSLSEQINNEGTESVKKSESQSKTKNGESDKSERDAESKKREPNGRSGYRDGDRDMKSDRDTRDNRDRDELRGNRSYDSLRGERTLKDSRNNSREKLYGSRSSLDQDYNPRDRTRRGDSRERERSYRDKGDSYDRYRDRDRPPSRSGSTVDGYGRRDYREYRDRDREYRDRDRENRDHRSRPDRYERPRSRQGESRPLSRQGDSDRPRSRTDYDRDQSYRDKYRGYDYDDYYRRGQYYDRQYYDYDYSQYYSQYGQGYYDEHGYYHPDPNARSKTDPKQAAGYDYYQRRSRTGTPGSLSDGGEEIANIADRSKTSEANSDKRRFDYPPDLHGYSRGGAYDDYYSYYGYEQDGHRWDPDISAWVATTTDVEPARQTPEKFVLPHVRACFGPNGQLVKVLPNRPADGQPATIEIQDVQDLLMEEEESQELRKFPGPLVGGDTYKDDVRRFCKEKAEECGENIGLEDRESAELIWRFLELLIHQRGTVDGEYIADLLLQGHEPTTMDYRRTGIKIAASADNLDVGDDESEDSRVSRGTTPVDRSRTTPVDRSMVSKPKPVEEVTDRFRHLLLHGKKKGALEWAMENNLWGHAFFLASKMEGGVHAKIMTRFANQTMRMNDPLQTLYQLMSGRQPASVTCVKEEKWGDWRPHLAMILSNHTHKPDMDRKSITKLGDTLASRGLLHASHFCYLMSQTSFGSFTKKTSKIVLIGSSHHLPLDLFANNEAIQCTEIYEYALALGNTSISMANFQYFKYMYAIRLIDCGLCQEALRYCEVIARNINLNPAFYPQILVKLLYDLSSQLKYSDPNMVEMEESPDPDWLRELHTTLVQFEEGAIQPISGSATPAYFPGTSASSESGEVGMYMQGPENGYSQDNSSIPNSGHMYRIQEQSHIQHQTLDNTQMQYQPQTMDQFGPDAAGQEGAQAQYIEQEGVQGQYDVQEGAQAHQYVPEAGQPQGTDPQYNSSGFTVPEQHRPAGMEGFIQQTDGQYGQLAWPDQQMTNQTVGYGQAVDQQHQGMTGQGYMDPTCGQFQHGANQNADAWSHGQQQHHAGFPHDVNLGESQSSAKSARSGPNRSSMASTSSYTNEEDDEEEDEDNVDAGVHHGGARGIFDIQPPQSTIIPPRLRKRTVSENSGNGPNQSSSKTEQKSSTNKEMPSKSKPGAAAGGGIWGKIGGLFSRKNEMKLPDDKEPSIVWDADKQKWVDKNASEADTAPAGPPPRDMDLSGTAPMSQPASQVPVAPSVAPSAGPSNMPPPAEGGNRFSRRKGLGAQSRYVDVMNPKPASTTSQVPSALFHTLPSSHSAPAIFNPTGSAEPSSQQPQKSETIPEEKVVPGSNNSSIPPPSELSGQQLSPSNDNATDAPMPTALPTMFNPAQFQQSAQGFKPPAPAGSGGPGHRLSSRRVYPK